MNRRIHRSQILVGAFAGLVVASLMLASATPTRAVDAAVGEMTSSGPLSRIIVGSDLACQVAHVADLSFEFFGSESGACGTFLAAGGVLYGPAELPAGSGASPRTPWTPVTQSPVTGSGRGGDPFSSVTIVDAGATQIRVDQLDTYVAGEESYRTDVRITNGNGSPVTAILYRAADCYLQDSDTGFGRVDDGAPACVISQAPDARIEQWLPLTPGSRFMEAGFSDVWAQIGAQRPFPDSCLCDVSVDNGAGLSWEIVVPAGGTTSVSHRTFFSPLGRRPESPSLSDSVPGPTDITLDPVIVAQSAVIAAGVVALVPFPAALFNSTLEEHYGEVMGAIGRFRMWLAGLVAGVVGRLRRRSVSEDALAAAPVSSTAPQTTSSIRADATSDDSAKTFWRTPVGIVLFLLATALLYGFLDPSFGSDAGSLATFLGLALGLTLLLFAFGVPMLALADRGGVPVFLRALPATIAVGIGCVLVSRLAGFQPGYLYGLVIGLVFARQLTVAEEGRAEAVAAGVGLGAGVIAWLLLPLVRVGAVPGDGFSSSIIETACATIVIGGLEGAVFAMLPLRFLPGEKVYSWDRRVWIALLALGTFGFCHILLNPTSGYLADTTRVSLFTVVGLLATFGVGSVCFWAYFRFRGVHPLKTS